MEELFQTIWKFAFQAFNFPLSKETYNMFSAGVGEKLYAKSLFSPYKGSEGR